MSYKIEELLALRDSVSESAVSIEKFADEDVIKGRWLGLRDYTSSCATFHLLPAVELGFPGNDTGFPHLHLSSLRREASC